MTESRPTISSKRGFIQSAAMQDAASRLLEAITRQDGVLLCGEMASGRQLFARAIHLAITYEHNGSVERLLRASMRGTSEVRPFVVVDCAAGDGLESRLFGVPSGAWEPASAGLERIAEGSQLHQAHGGTVVFRQLPDLPARLQTRLARVLRDGEVWVEPRADSSMTGPAVQRIGFRPVAMSTGPADDDRVVPELLRRMAQTRIQVPSLRQRRDDIPALVRLLLIDLCAEREVAQKVASAQAASLLAALPWPGNVKELKTLLATLIAKTPGRLIRVADVLSNIRLDASTATFVYSGTLRQARERFEKDYVAAVLEQHHGRMAEAAKALGIQRTNLYRKVRQLSVERRRTGPRSS